jgi:hypothetical protein
MLSALTAALSLPMMDSYEGGASSAIIEGVARVR